MFGLVELQFKKKKKTCKTLWFQNQVKPNKNVDPTGSTSKNSGKTLLYLTK